MARLLAVVPLAAVLHSTGSAFATTPVNDPCYPQQQTLFPWGVPPSITRVSLHGMNAEGAWVSLDQRGAGTRVGVIDSAYLLSHQDFPSTRILDSTLDNSPNKVHGTAVASIIGATGDNELDIAGAAYECVLVLANQTDPTSTDPQEKWIPARLLGMSSPSPGHGASIINNCWQGASTSTTFPDIADTMQAIASVNVVDSGRGGLGALIVVAAGNEQKPVGRSVNTLYASVPEVITVANLGPDGERGGLGQTGSNYGPWIDVSAPGDFSFAFDGTTGGGGNCNPFIEPDCGFGEGPGGTLPDRYGSMETGAGDCGTGPLARTGLTSSAAPHASAALAMMLSNSTAQGLEGPQLARILRHTARKVTVASPQYLNYAPLTLFSDSLGYGLIDAEAACDESAAGNSWPEGPRSLVGSRGAGGVSLAWTNATAPAGGYEYGEYDGVIVVRYLGDVWDQTIWPRTPGTTELSKPERPDDIASYNPLDTLDLNGNAIVLEVDDTSTFVDTSADRDVAYTYAIYTFNSNLYYSVPSFTVVPSRKRHLIMPNGSASHTSGVSYDDPAIIINAIIGLEVVGDAAPTCGSSDGDAWQLPPTSTCSSLIDPFDCPEYLEFEYDLSGYCSASLAFDEIVEVFGFAFAGDMFCRLLVKRDTDTAWTVLIRDHTSITYDSATGKYAWRSHDISLDDFCGSEINVRWQVKTATGSMPMDSLGWFLDNIAVRGEPACPCDLDRDGDIDSQDLAILSGSWNATYGFCDESDPDIDRNGVVNSSDWAELLGSYGPCAGCPGAESFVSGGGEAMFLGGLPSAVAVLVAASGFESLESYLTWFDGLSVEAQLSHLNQAQEILEALE